MVKNIIAAVSEVIATIDNVNIRNALSDSYHDSANTLTIIEDFFREFTSKQWSVNSKRVFFKNWRSPGYGSASFCALTFRILTLCDQANTAESQKKLFNSVVQIAEIAHEDVGIGGINHQELYEMFASTISGDDEWKLNKYQIKDIKKFLFESRNYRQNGEDMTYAMMLSLPEELYNHGEFTFIAPFFNDWHDNILKLPPENRKNDLKFIIDHLGTTESHHFISAISGLESYCSALNLNLDTSLLYKCNKKIINDMATYDQNFMSAITASN